MSLQYSASRILHDEHMASLALLGEVERVALAGKSTSSNAGEELGRLLVRLRRTLDGEVLAHFDFEEQALFPLLAEFGDGDLGQLLTEEHLVLREVFEDLGRCADNAAASGFSDESRTSIRRVCAELIERLQSHIEKEERALLPALENALTPETDAEVSARHYI